jgi:hypothetical protein
MLPHALFDMPEYMALSFPAQALINVFIRQYNKYNNGDLCNAYNVLKKRGWKSETTVRRATKELIDAGFVVLSRQGGRNMCNLYALTWLPVNECNGKQLEIKPSNEATLKLKHKA